MHSKFAQFSYKGQRVFKARSDAYSFDIFNDEWQIGLRDKVKLSWMHDVDFDEASLLNLRLLMAKYVSVTSPGTVRGVGYALGNLNAQLTLEAIQARLASTFRFIQN
jgi:hypothetical protein